MKLPDTLEIEVTDSDIENGVPCEPGECPLALAVIRAVAPYQPGTSVGIDDCALVYLDVVEWIWTDVESRVCARDFVKMFDGDQVVDGFKGTIRPMNEEDFADDADREVQS